MRTALFLLAGALMSGGCHAEGQPPKPTVAEPTVAEPTVAEPTVAEPRERAPDPELVAALRGHVQVLAGEIGGRGIGPGDAGTSTLDAAAAYLRQQWTAQGYEVHAQAYTVGEQQVENLFVRVPGRSPALVVVGAHYDTCDGNPGADDNASGVAALLELSRRLAATEPERTLHLVAFANEEPPYFKDPQTMGSAVHARALREQGEEVEAMLSLESIGYFSDVRGSQHYPAILAPLYPETGDFVAVVGKNGSRPLVRRVVRGLETHGPIPVESIAAPASITGIDWSDHWSFWREGWAQAVMVTDTATYRNPNYHEMSDLPETLDYRRLALVTEALEATIRELAGS
ncbi:Aminopeptidase YwaD precursor [Enhygromyxa salina]|uniref:Aminopeptidase YwaD n=1 Tax=Enhygromyxa salina TaxID=215803 RepID=A0A2S9XJY0_9BACT|nr:M28 family peptidase [Enhygromyxa salina]PRP93188.1 Aminopeptidase YwaD precursor [Enhygromyxa salina]